MLSVSDHKPKPFQAQAIKARTAKFKLRYAGQAVLASPSDKSAAPTLDEMDAMSPPGRNDDLAHYVTLGAITNESDFICVIGIWYAVADAIKIGWNQMGTQAKGFFVALLFS
jgi:hypothetical protein